MAAEDTRKLDQQIAEQVAAQVRSERTRIAAEEAKKAKLATSAEMEAKDRELVSLKQLIAENKRKLAEAQKAQAEVLKKERERDAAKRELELKVQQRVCASSRHPIHIVRRTM